MKKLGLLAAMVLGGISLVVLAVSVGGFAWTIYTARTLDTFNTVNEEQTVKEMAAFLEQAPKPVREQLLGENRDLTLGDNARPSAVPIDPEFEHRMHELMHVISLARDDDPEVQEQMNGLAADPTRALNGLDSAFSKSIATGSSDLDRLVGLAEQAAGDYRLRDSVIGPLIEKEIWHALPVDADAGPFLRMTALYFSIENEPRKRRAFLDRALATNKNPRVLSYLRALDLSPSASDSAPRAPASE